MTPTPPYNPALQDGPAFRSAGRRRPQVRTPYDASHHTPPNPQIPITPLPDNGVDVEDVDDEDVGSEDEDVGEDIDGEEEVERENDVDADEEEEGGIEEGLATTRSGTYGWSPRAHAPSGLLTTAPDSIAPFIETYSALLREIVNRERSVVPMDIDPPFDATALGLKEIANLASWTVSSCKPGCGVEALRDEDTGQFWQSDGPQPHHLNIHFSRLVSIRSIRIFLDFEADESYTPTKITLLAGTGYHDLIPFSALEFTQPKGWIDVPLEHVGGGKDGKTLRAFLVQVKIIENHQNGKDTHVRGLKIYARDERIGRAVADVLGEEEVRKSKAVLKKSEKSERAFLMEPDWMGEPELR